MNNISKRRSSSSKSRKNKSADLKVVYISSPMKVKTCASNFRSTVQQLTGRDSDLVDRLMDEYANNNNLNITNEVLMFDADLKGGSRRQVEIPETPVEAVCNSYESPTSSGSMPFEESAAAAGGLMFADVVGGGGLDEGFSFDEIFGPAGFLLECPLDEVSQFCY